MITSANAWITVDGWAVIALLAGLILGAVAYWMYSHYYHHVVIPDD
jgi:hypothetical protein